MKRDETHEPKPSANNGSGVRLRIDGSGDTRYHGNRGLAGDGWNSNWYEESPSGGGIEVSQGSYHLALTHDDDRPNAYDVTVVSGSAESVELPGPYRLPTNPQANTPPSGALGPGGFSPPDDPSGVAALRAEVSTAGHNASGDNGALEEYFTTLVTGVEQLGSELGDKNYEYGGSSRTPSEPASDYGARSSINVPSLGKPNFAQLIELANSTFPAEPALPPPGEHATPYMLVSAPTANRSLLQSFTGWLDDWFSGLMGTPTAEERARLNREALQGPRPDLIVGQGFTPETLAQMGQAQIGQSRFLDGKYGRGSITAYEVGINTIEYSQASIKEVVLAVAGAKLAEFGIQGGRWALTKTPAGQWVVKQGENAVVLTADQVKKLRDAIRNGIKGGESLADSDVDRLMLAPVTTATTYGKNAIAHFRSHAQHIRETARRLEIAIPKSPSNPETLVAMKSFIDKVVSEGTKKTGKFKDVVDAEWYKLGDAIVVRRPNGEWLSFLDYSKKSPLSNLWDSM